MHGAPPIRPCQTKEHNASPKRSEVRIAKKPEGSNVFGATNESNKKQRSARTSFIHIFKYTCMIIFVHTLNSMDIKSWHLPLERMVNCFDKMNMSFCCISNRNILEPNMLHNILWNMEFAAECSESQAASWYPTHKCVQKKEKSWEIKLVCERN